MDCAKCLKLTAERDNWRNAYGACRNLLERMLSNKDCEDVVLSDSKGNKKLLSEWLKDSNALD